MSTWEASEVSEESLVKEFSSLQRKDIVIYRPLHKEPRIGYVAKIHEHSILGNYVHLREVTQYPGTKDKKITHSVKQNRKHILKVLNEEELSKLDLKERRNFVWGLLRQAQDKYLARIRARKAKKTQAVAL